jgi:sialate O-acetylesterase
VLDNIGTFSAVCWFYGRYIYDAYAVPMGLISSNWGGTEIQLWSSPEAIDACTNKSQTQVPPKPTHDSYLWNSMIYPFTKMVMFGAIWYQGEANSKTPAEAEAYKCHFPAMINDWRKKWYEGTNQHTDQSFPFGFVQLAAEGSDNTSEGFFPIVRWSQTAGYGYVPNDILKNVFMAVAMDLGDPDSPHGSVHPRDKQDVGRRLSTAGRAIAYGESSIYINGPIMKRATVSSSTTTLISVTVYYENIVGHLLVLSKYGFEISCMTPGHDDIWVSGTTINAEEENKLVNVQFSQCNPGYKAEMIRYAWRQDPCVFQKCSIYGTTSGYPSLLPAPPFIMKLEH